jgi:hypothetical protein
MAAQERPKTRQNWNQRSVCSFGPKFRIDMNNPQMGLNGADVFNIYAVTEEKNQCVIGLSEGGLSKIYSDQSLEIVAGQKSQSTGVDINIVSKSGDVCITAEKNGQVRIRGANIVVDADENLDLVAGRDVTIKAGGRFLIKSNQADCDALMGNLVPEGASFIEQVFSSTFVGADVIGAFTGGPIGAVAGAALGSIF